MKTVELGYKPEFTTLEIDDLHEFQGELKELSKKDYKKLKTEILETKFNFAPHVWLNPQDKSFYLIDGHQRKRGLTAMREEGYRIPLIPCVVVEAETYQEAKRKVLQGTSQYGQMTSQGLYEFLETGGFKLDFAEDRFRFPEINFGAFKAEFTETPEAEPDITLPKNPICQRGDLWILGGNHRLLCGDSTNKSDVERLMNGEKADMVFTDPPYNLAGNHGGELSLLASARPNSYGKLKEAEWNSAEFDVRPALDCLLEQLKEDCTVYVSISHYVAPKIWAWMSEWAKFYSFCVWKKTNPMPSLSKRHWTWDTELICYATRGKHTFNFPSQGNASSVWESATATARGEHPTPKPLKIPEIAILHSSKPGDLIYEAFSGSGTTLMACEKNQRRCNGIEIDKLYCDVILNRFLEQTGKDPVREDGLKWSVLRQQVSTS